MIKASLILVLVLCLYRSPTGASFATLGKGIGFNDHRKNNKIIGARNPPSNAQSTTGAAFGLSRLFLVAKDEPGSSENFVFTDHLVSKSGLPVCKYALGGAARSTQPTSLVEDYCESVQNWFGTSDEAKATTTKMAPFLFYYNPHRYPDFMKGIRQASEDSNTKLAREDLFLASGGTDRSDQGMEQRLSDALAYSGRDYLDMFVLEYVCSYEDEDEILGAISKARSWIESGKVRYVAASTHSHQVGAWLGSLKDKNEETPLLDAMMLRYNMAHKLAAERLSFPVCSEAGIPVLAFTTTRWNRLQDGHTGANPNMRPPTTPECLSFALSSRKEPWPVKVALHSARDADELEEAMACLKRTHPITEREDKEWRDYGDLKWNDIDGFDEYPEEQTE